MAIVDPADATEISFVPEAVQETLSPAWAGVVQGNVPHQQPLLVILCEVYIFHRLGKHLRACLSVCGTGAECVPRVIS